MNSDCFFQLLYEGLIKCPICGYRYSIDDVDYPEAEGIVYRGFEGLVLKCRKCGFETPIRLFVRRCEDDTRIRRIARTISNTLLVEQA